MKIKNLILTTLVAASMSTTDLKASVTINFDIGEITSGGSLIGSGTFLFVSHGTNNVLDSASWSTGTSFLKGDDLLMGAFSISNGAVTSSIPGYNAPSLSMYGVTKFTGIFIKDLTDGDVNYSTGGLLGGKEFGTSGGTSYDFGSYRTDSVEDFNMDPTGLIAWVLPSDGALVSLNALSNTDIGGSGIYTGGRISAPLAANSSFIIVPEPSSSALLMLGVAGLVALRRLRKV